MFVFLFQSPSLRSLGSPGCHPIFWGIPISTDQLAKSRQGCLLIAILTAMILRFNYQHPILTKMMIPRGQQAVLYSPGKRTVHYVKKQHHCRRYFVHMLAPRSARSNRMKGICCFSQGKPVVDFEHAGQHAGPRETRQPAHTEFLCFDRQGLTFIFSPYGSHDPVCFLVLCQRRKKNEFYGISAPRQTQGV